MSEIITIELVDLAQEINTEHEQCQAAMRSSLEHAVRAGELLLQAKALVNHGEWLPWLAGNCCFSERTARAYMRVAEHWPELKSAATADLTLAGALKLLAAPSNTQDSANEATLPGVVESYVKELGLRADRAETEEQVREVYNEYKAFSKASKSIHLQIEQKRNLIEAKEYLSDCDNSPVNNDPQSPDWLLPFEFASVNNILSNSTGLFFGVNMWQKNFRGYCAELLCWQPIERKLEWGLDHHFSPGWHAWGTEALGPPRADWRPTFCENHQCFYCDEEGNDIDWSGAIETVRLFLAGNGRMPLDADPTLKRLVAEYPPV